MATGGGGGPGAADAAGRAGGGRGEAVRGGARGCGGAIWGWGRLYGDIAGLGAEAGGAGPGGAV